jgi:uncharacterized protein YndB with AHSA1/START domain
MIAFQTSIRIERPIDVVFAYVSDPSNLSHWNSAVRSVRSTSTPAGAVGSTYVMERALPTGRAVNELEVVELEPPAVFAFRTTSGPTPFVYRYGFASDGAGAVVTLDATLELNALLGPLLKRGVNDNLATLKEILER